MAVYTAGTGTGAFRIEAVVPGCLARCVFLKAFDRKVEAITVPQAAESVCYRSHRYLSRIGGQGTIRALRRVCAQTAGAFVNVIAPADCRACGGPLAEARQFAVCNVCLGQLRRETAALCGKCGERLNVEDVRGGGFVRGTVRVCNACEADPPQFARATAFAAYDGVLRRLIRLHKFESMETLAEPLGEQLAVVLGEAAHSLLPGPVHVVAVPLFGHKRRYNQSAQIADAALRRLRGYSGPTLVASHAALRRVRETESQSQLTPAQRRENVRGAFAVDQNVSEWKVILVDDVYTTSATAAECARTLVRAGAAAVHVVTLARTQPDRSARWGENER